jgi:hypothetical protein
VPALEASRDPELLLDGGLQTGGLGVVVSFGAVGDLYVQRVALLSGPGAALWTVLMIADAAGGRAVNRFNEGSPGISGDPGGRTATLAQPREVPWPASA